MAHRYNIRAAWLTYVGIQALWVSLILLTPLAAASQPSRLWALPLCGITVASGAHMMLFRHEYNALLRRMVRLFPPFRYLMRYLVPRERDAGHFMLLGAAYALLGILAATLILLA